MNILTRHIYRDHVIVGGVVALIAMPFGDYFSSLLFWLSSVLIDVDHWFVLVYRTKFRFWNARSLMRFHELIFERRNATEFLGIDIFHTLEFVGLLGITAFAKIHILQPVFYGVIFHCFIDVIHLTRYDVFNKRCHSLVEYGWRRKKLFAQGRNPDLVFQEAFEALCIQQDSRRSRSGA